MSNVAESVAVLVECFNNVAFQDDGLRPYNSSMAPYGLVYLDDTGLTGYSISSDGDHCTINTGTGSANDTVYYAKTISFDTYSTSTYRYAIVRAKTLTDNANWINGTYYSPSSSISTNYYSDKTFVTYYYTIPPGTIDKISFGVRTTDGDNAIAVFDYYVLSATTPVTLFPEGFDTNNVITEGFDSADLTCSYPESDQMPKVSSHIKIWASKGSSIDLHKIFTGKVNTLERISKGKDYRRIGLSANGYGKYLTEKTWKGTRSSLAADIIRDVVSDLVNEGLITTYNIQTTPESIKVSKDEEETVWDILSNDIINIDTSTGKGLDWDMYVDFGGDLHMFQNGYFTSSINLANDMFGFTHRESNDRLINEQEIWGAFEKQIGGDNLWTDSSTVGWVAYPGAGVTLAPYEGTIDFWAKWVYTPVEGTTCIQAGKAISTGSEDFWVEKTIDTADVSAGGELVFNFAYYCVLAKTATQIDTWILKADEIPNTIDMTIFAFTDDDNYFVQGKLTDGGEHNSILEGLYNMYKTHIWWSLPTTKMEIQLGTSTDKDWTIVGDPDWRNITKFRFQVNSPISVASYPAFCLIDAMTLTTRYYGFYEHTGSKSSYGTETGIPLIRNNLVSDTECTVAASLIVEAYKKPIETIDNYEVSDNFNLTLGTEYAFNTLDIDTSLSIRSIKQNLSNLYLKTKVDLSERYIPSSEILMATFQRQLDYLGRDLELWKLMTTDKAITSGDAGRLDWWDVDPSFGIFSWTDSNGIIVQGAENGSYTEYYSAVDPGDATIDFGRIQLSIPEAAPGAVKNIGLYPGPSSTVDTPTRLSSDNTITFATMIRCLGFVSGDAMYVGPGLLNGSGIGFTYSNGNLYGRTSTSGGAASATVLTSLVNNQLYRLNAIYYPDDSVVFFVNGTFAASITTNLPNSDMISFNFYLQGDSSDGRTLSILSYQVGEAI